MDNNRYQIYQPATYNERQKYNHDRIVRNTSSYIADERDKMYHQSSIHGGITTPYIEHVPVISLVTERQYFFLIHHFILVVILLHKKSA